jgi:hypothetical protein
LQNIGRYLHIAAGAEIGKLAAISPLFDGGKAVVFSLRFGVLWGFEVIERETMPI